MSDPIQEMDNILLHIDGISDERDSVPLLLAVRDQWSKVKAMINTSKQFQADVEKFKK